MTLWLASACVNLAQLGLCLAYLTTSRSPERWQAMAASLLMLVALIVAEGAAFGVDRELRRTIVDMNRLDDAMARQALTVDVLTRVRDRAAAVCARPGAG